MKLNKTCHRDRIARLTAPCPSHKNFNVKTLTFANANTAANADVDAGGSTIALPGVFSSPGLRPGELKTPSCFMKRIFSFLPVSFSLLSVSLLRFLLVCFPRTPETCSHLHLILSPGSLDNTTKKPHEVFQCVSWETRPDLLVYRITPLTAPCLSHIRLCCKTIKCDANTHIHVWLTTRAHCTGELINVAFTWTGQKEKKHLHRAKQA